MRIGAAAGTNPNTNSIDTGIFDDNRYFECHRRVCEGAPDDILPLHHHGRIAVPRRHNPLLPTLWFRNTWSWGRDGEGYWDRPRIDRTSKRLIAAHQSSLCDMNWSSRTGFKEFLFTENETNAHRLLARQSQPSKTRSTST